MLKRYLLLLVLCLIPSELLADVRLEVTPRTGEIGEQFILSVIIDTASDVGIPELSPTKDFSVAYIGPQTSVSIINGQVSRQAAYTYKLLPRRAGSLQTPGVSIIIDGKTVILEPISVTVAPASTPAPRKIRGLSLRQTVEPRELYVGQQASTTLELRTAINLIEPQFVDMAFDGFWTETIAENERSSRIINGDQYDILRFRKALYPLVSGTLEIPERTLKARIRDTRRTRNFPFNRLDPFDMDIFDNFFGTGSLADITLNSNSLSLEVKDLPVPPQGLPSWGASSPLVGETTLSLTAPPGDLAVGETKAVEVVLLSTGNLSPIKSAVLSVPRSIKVYEDAPQTKTFESGGALMQRKTFGLSLVAMQPGQVTIPALELGFFDTSEGKFRIARSQPLQFTVTGSALPALGAAQPRKEEILTEPQATPQPQPVFEPVGWKERLFDYISPSLLVLAVAVLSALSLLVWFARRIYKRRKPEWEMMIAIESAADLHQLARAFKAYCALTLTGSPSDQGTEQLRAIISSKLSDGAAVFQAQSVLDALDEANYSARAINDVETLRKRALSAAKRMRAAFPA